MGCSIHHHVRVLPLFPTVSLSLSAHASSFGRQGIFFNGTAYYDGAPGVTQCPIPSGASCSRPRTPSRACADPCFRRLVPHLRGPGRPPARHVLVAQPLERRLPGRPARCVPSLEPLLERAKVGGVLTLLLFAQRLSSSMPSRSRTSTTTSSPSSSPTGTTSARRSSTTRCVRRLLLLVLSFPTRSHSTTMHSYSRRPTWTTY